MTTLGLALCSLGLVTAIFTLVWAWSVRRRDVSVVDAWWGPAFVVAAGVSLVAGGGDRGRRALVFGLVLLWGARLALHLAARNHGQPEDRRYAAMRASGGPRFAWRSLVTVFLLQAVLSTVIAWPIFAIGASPRALGWLDAAAALVVLTGLTIEAVADAQLARWRRSPGSSGRVMDHGLWRYSRHPNYFGDAVVWWGFGLFAIAAVTPLALVGPAVMTLFLLRVSGVTLLEQTIGERRPGYAAYVARTSAFVPWPPRGPRS